ncbi:MAG: ATP-dependent RecD-like DNA helicase [Tenacibaculum sp.]
MTASAHKFYNEILAKFPYKATNKQRELLNLLVNFIFSDNKNALFILKGFAGTGKTTSVGAVVSNLWRVKKKFILLAPTGRAAKVISGYSGKQALTIHKKIYFPKVQKNGSLRFVMQVNKHTDTVFLVDEASMISDEQQSTKLFENGSLLNDLISYVYSGKNCKLIFIGDTAQLPPVKLSLSPALEADKLSARFDKEVIQIELNQVVRQHEYSGILNNATALRSLIQNRATDFKFSVNFDDIKRLQDSYEIQDAIADAFQDDTGVEESAVIVYSNKRANLYNKQIRVKIKGRENEICAGDYIMVVKNNYFWLKETPSAGFIANGDICKVLQINAIKELYGFRFAEAKIMMIDYPDIKAFNTVLLLNTLMSESPSLSYEESDRLYKAVREDFAHEKSKYKQLLGIRNNKYFNALQVKFSYAMTCHKSQGGQWKRIFVEQPYLPEGPTINYLRWLYTAITRAEDKLYLIGFEDSYFLD